MCLGLLLHSLVVAICCRNSSILLYIVGKNLLDLEQRKGPFAVINATDMVAGQEVSFAQDFFDWLCVDLNDVEIARASGGIQRRTINFFTHYAK